MRDPALNSTRAREADPGIPIISASARPDRRKRPSKKPARPQPVDGLVQRWLLGGVAAHLDGVSLEDMAEGQLPVPAFLSPPTDAHARDYVLRVSGESMADMDLHTGDLVLIQGGADCLTGDICVVVFEDPDSGAERATLKKVYFDPTHPDAGVTLVSLAPGFPSRTLPPTLFRRFAGKFLAKL